MSEATHLLELAVAQFTGWKCCKDGETIVGLVRSMGLEEHEWQALKKGDDVAWLGPDDQYEIDAYFQEQAPNTRRRTLKSTYGLEPS